MAACTQQVHLNDIGTIFRATINDCVSGQQQVLDVSGATTLQLIFKAPSGNTKTKTAVFTTDGTNGQVEYTTVSGDIDETGVWKIQAYIVLPSGSWRSDIGKFTVHENL